MPIDACRHHLALTYDGSEQRVYLDGVLEAQAMIGAITNIRENNRTGIGASPYNPSQRPLGGAIAEVRVWNRARSAPEIAADMCRQLVGDEHGLAGYWPLDDGAGAMAADISPNANAGTLRNGLGWLGGETFTFWKVVGPPPCTMLFLR